MHALKLPEGTTYPIWFGGSYDEHWSDDYSLFVSYKDRSSVIATLTGEGWKPTGGDAALCASIEAAPAESAIRRYFRTAASVYAASQECLRRAIPLTRIDELFRFSDPFAAPELLRLMMDDCGFRFEESFPTVSRCCERIALDASEQDELSVFQPRTAVLAELLRRAKQNLLAVEHDGSRREFRDPPRALRCGEGVTIAFRLLSGRLNGASLCVFGDKYRTEIPMTADGSRFSARFTAPEEAQALWYSIRLEAAEGSYYICPNETQCCGELCGSRRAGFRLTVFRADFETPEWFRHSVMYQVFPDRFAFSDDDTAQKGIDYHLALGQRSELHRSLDEPPRWKARPGEKGYTPDDFYGGTLRAIEGKLPYLKELGISCLYLNPIVEARSNHRYDASDYRRPDPILGTVEDFKHLCKEAGKHGIRLILDGVYSHTGDDSVYFDRYGHYGGKGAYSGPMSPYYKWYEFKRFPDEYRCWWGFSSLPEVDERNPSWQREIITGAHSIVKLWLKRGASGWRLDVADELPDEVLALIRDVVKETEPDAPIIGEVWEDCVIKESYGSRRRYALGDALDSVMNYPLRAAVLDFIHGRMDACQMRDFLIGQRMNYPKPLYYALMNLLGSHDVERLRTALSTPVALKTLPRAEQLAFAFDPAEKAAALERERLCAALQFALPGVPSVYYGDEQGMEGACDPFNRAPFREGDGALCEYYASLAARRNGSDALRGGEAVIAAASREVLTVLRFVRGGRSALGEEAETGAWLLAVNRSDEPQPCTAELDAIGLGALHGVLQPFEARWVSF